MKPLVTIGPGSLEAIGSRASVFGATSAAYPTTNQSIFIPFALSEPTIFTHLWAYMGATVGNNNIDLGVYDESGIRLANLGATLTSDANTIKMYDITDILLGIGRFFLAVHMSGTTDALFRNPIASGEQDSFGMAQHSINVAGGLPATATFAKRNNTYIPQIGLSTRGTI